MDSVIETKVLGHELPGVVSTFSDAFSEIRPIDCRHSGDVYRIAAASFPSVWSEQDFCYFLAHENRVCFGLFSLGKGSPRLRTYFLALLVQGDLDIISIATAPEDRRLGLGGQILKHICEDKRIQRAFLEVEVDNEAAIALYVKAGFVILGQRNAYYGPNRDAFLMRWERVSS